MAQQFQRIAKPVEAWQISSRLADAPEWVRTYRHYDTAYGDTPIIETLGQIVVPTGKGRVTAGAGAWLVMEGTELLVLTPDQFNATFEPAPEPAVA